MITDFTENEIESFEIFFFLSYSCFKKTFGFLKQKQKNNRTKADGVEREQPSNFFFTKHPA
jgi:hypothetical protein